MKPYEGTDVAVAKSQEQIRHLLKRYGSDGINFGEEWNLPPNMPAEVLKQWKPHIFVKFLYRLNDTQHLVIFKVPIPIAEKFSPAGRERTQAAIEKLQGQLERGVWRAVFWAIKSRMEAVEFGIETFVEAFLSHFAIPGTEVQISERIIPALKQGNLRMLER
jgi:hypothetical protein